MWNVQCIFAPFLIGIRLFGSPFQLFLWKVVSFSLAFLPSSILAYQISQSQPDQNQSDKACLSQFQKKGSQSGKRAESILRVSFGF